MSKVEKILYRHLKPNGETFYIGIGYEKRAYKKYGRNPMWHNVVDKYGYEVEILKRGLTQEEAVELEKILIQHYGRRDLKQGTLVNMTDGGEGHSNHIRTKEYRDNLSRKQKGRVKSPETCKRISESKKGVPCLKGRIKVVQMDLDGNDIKIWDSATTAYRALKNKPDSNYSGHINSVCKGKRSTTLGYKWRYYNG